MDNSSFQFPFANTSWGKRLDKKFWIITGLIVLLLGTAFVAKRTYSGYSTPEREFDWSARGLFDFHSLYLYSDAYAHGVNPYSATIGDHYVVTRPAAPFSPLQFMLHWPFTKLDLATADVVFSVFHWALMGLLALYCIRMSHVKFDWALWLWIFGFIIFSRPGHVGIFTGYLTIQLVLGTIIAIHYSKSNPWLAGVGFMLASGKPTYFIPLTILLLFRRDIKTLVIGGALTGIVAIGGLAYLASYSSFGDVIDGIKQGQEAFHEDPTEMPINTWTRIDLLGMVAKVLNWVPGNAVYLGAMFGLIIAPGLAIWRARKFETDHGAGGLSAVILVLAMLVTLYHHSYDCLLTTVAFFALALAGERVCPEIPKFWRFVMVGLLFVPAINYASTQSFRDKLGLDQYGFVWQSITMVNGACLLAALVIAMCVAFRMKADEKVETS